MAVYRDTQGNYCINIFVDLLAGQKTARVYAFPARYGSYYTLFLALLIVLSSVAVGASLFEGYNHFGWLARPSADFPAIYAITAITPVLLLALLHLLFTTREVPVAQLVIEKRLSIALYTVVCLGFAQFCGFFYLFAFMDDVFSVFYFCHFLVLLCLLCMAGLQLLLLLLKG